MWSGKLGLKPILWQIHVRMISPKRERKIAASDDAVKAVSFIRAK